MEAYRADNNQKPNKSNKIDREYKPDIEVYKVDSKLNSLALLLIFS